MTIVLVLLLLLGAFLFALATFNVPTRFNLVAAGLFCWILTVLLPALHLG